MVKHDSGIPDTTIEALARSFFKESSTYGFGRMDYLRFVNTLLDIATVDTGSQSENAGQRIIPGVEEPATKSAKLPDIDAVSLPLNGVKLTIRNYDPLVDRQTFQEWLVDAYGRYFLLSLTSMRSESLDELAEDAGNILGIITLPDKTPIGAIAYLNCDRAQRKAELRKLIGAPEARGKGLGKAATELWIQHGSQGLGLKKIYLNTLDTNIRNIRLNEEMGFKIEGILRNEVFFDGKHHDVLRMGLWLG